MSEVREVDSMEAGRRERGKAEKQTRIRLAAQELFAERGYEAVTTQQVADRADIAHGTLFRYAASKAELLLMVHNEVFAAAVTRGEADAAGIADPVERVLTLIAPVIYSGRDHDENIVAYERDLLFGPPDAPFRRAGLQIVTRLEASIADCLAGGGRHDDDTVAAARAVFAVLHMEIAQPVVRADTPGVASGALRRQVNMIVAGHRARAQQD
ncbi:TetR/AcrR family transcriptional regulator [Rhodococcus sp. NPDC058505]|uniref:TetR/AcrR family transcriptional regulator n=1 Tax=unclassified Rhodococcus (in: high G+C Gram-positive bacteria) TaxID=192944 RepID=UPI00364F8D13